MDEEVEIPEDWPIDPDSGLPKEFPLELSRGIHKVRQDIGNFLRDNMPAALAAARIAWGLNTSILPDPISYHEYNPLTQWQQVPIIGVMALEDSNWVRSDYDYNMSLEYNNVSYSMRLFVAAGTPRNPDGSLIYPPYDTAMQVRDDLLTVLRALILLHPSLGDPTRYTVDENRLSTEYHPLFNYGENRPDFLAEGAIAFPLQVRESVVRKPFGTVEYTEVIEGLLPPRADEIIVGYVPPLED